MHWEVHDRPQTNGKHLQHPHLPNPQNPKSQISKLNNPNSKYTMPKLQIPKCKAQWTQSNALDPVHDTKENTETIRNTCRRRISPRAHAASVSIGACKATLLANSRSDFHETLAGWCTPKKKSKTKHLDLVIGKFTIHPHRPTLSLVVKPQINKRAPHWLCSLHCLVYPA